MLSTAEHHDGISQKEPEKSQENTGQQSEPFLKWQMAHERQNCIQLSSLNTFGLPINFQSMS